MNNIQENPVGLCGFDFVEFSSPDPKILEKTFTEFGFSTLRKFADKDITYYNQNDIHVIINDDPNSASMDFSKIHGPCASSTGWRVENAEEAFRVAVERGAKAAKKKDYPMPAIEGVGGSLIYFVDNWEDKDRWEKTGFTETDNQNKVESKGFALIDHLTNNVHKGKLEPLAKFYKDVFGFSEVRYFDINGVKTGLLSYALRSPCGSFCIPINESKDPKSQIQEYLDEYKGEGIQHIAFLTSDMLTTMKKMEGTSIETLDIDDDYYDEVFDRIPNVTEDKEKLKHYNLLIDGDESGYLVQIFSKNLIGPIFFEFIQRKNHIGFGEGNFGALFRAIERDQEKRGVL